MMDVIDVKLVILSVLVMRVIRDVEDRQHGQNIHLMRERRIAVMILKAIVQLRTVLHNNISGEYSRTTTIHHRIAIFL